MRIIVEKDLQSMVEKKDLADSGPYSKLKFINKFYLYNGLSKFSQENEIFWKSMETFEA